MLLFLNLLDLAVNCTNVLTQVSRPEGNASTMTTIKTMTIEIKLE